VTTSTHSAITIAKVCRYLLDHAHICRGT
jgi:hypothetical protein